MLANAHTLDATVPADAEGSGEARGRALRARRRLDATTAGARPISRRDAYAVEVISDYDAFVALEPEWNDAVTRARVPHPFLRHEWVRTWWDAFQTPSSRLYIQVVRANGRVMAIAPLMRETVTMYGMPVRQVRFIHNDHTPRTDMIIAGEAEACCEAIWRALGTGRERWDVLLLSQLERGSKTGEFFSGVAAREGLRTGTWRSSDSPYLALTGGWEAYLNSLPAKFRSNLRNRWSRLSKIGPVSLEVLTGRASIAAAAEDAWRLESSGWKRDAGTAISSDPAVQRFYTSLIERATDAGWLELLFLKVGDRRVATSYGARFANRLFLFKTGYDPEFATGAPFKTLTSLAIEDACNRGLSEVDFLGDAEPWKLEWTSTSRGHDWLYVFSGTIRARLLHSVKFQWLPELKRWRS